jgi:hypothetical protein
MPCNPNYSRRHKNEDHSSKPAQSKNTKPYLGKESKKRTEVMAQVAELLSIKDKSMSSNPSTVPHPKVRY